MRRGDCCGDYAPGKRERLGGLKSPSYQRGILSLLPFRSEVRPQQLSGIKALEIRLENTAIIAYLDYRRADPSS